MSKTTATIYGSLIISTLAIGGIAMAPLPVAVVLGEFGTAIAFGLKTG